MKNSEARQILIDYNAWRRLPKTLKRPHPFEQCSKAIDAAIIALSSKNILTTDKIIESDKLTTAYLLGFDDGKRSKSSIAQAIRDSAVNWPKKIGFVEHGILDTFQEWSARHWWTTLNNDSDTQAKNQARTFMLLVAEALES